MSTFPPDIIIDILSRLPVEPLLRFRCVSKLWCGLIDAPHFIKLHLNRSIATASELSVFGTDLGNLYSVDLHGQLNELHLVKSQFSEAEIIRLCDSCNGLLLFESIEFGRVKLFLFNPSTREHRVLPKQPIAYAIARELQGFVNCLGYDSDNDDYKVCSIPLILYGRSKANKYSAEARIYSLKLDSWRVIKNFAPKLYRGNLVDGGSYLNGALHTIDDPSIGIVAFYVEIGDFTVLPLPTDFVKKDFYQTSVKVVGECLCVVGVYGNGDEETNQRFDIWLMMEYGVEESWTMLMSFTATWKFWMPQLVLHSKKSNEALISLDCEKLSWYDLTTKRFRVSEIHGLPMFIPHACVGSLVPVKRRNYTNI